MPPVTLNELLARARATLTRLADRPLDTASDGDAHALATGLLDLLGEDPPCGFEMVIDTGSKPPTIQLFADVPISVTAADMRPLCALWLRGADMADSVELG